MCVIGVVGGGGCVVVVVVVDKVLYMFDGVGNAVCVRVCVCV